MTRSLSLLVLLSSATALAQPPVADPLPVEHYPGATTTLVEGLKATPDIQFRIVGTKAVFWGQKFTNSLDEPVFYSSPQAAFKLTCDGVVVYVVFMELVVPIGEEGDGCHWYLEPTLNAFIDETTSSYNPAYFVGGTITCESVDWEMLP